VIFDRQLRTPATARVFSTLDSGPVIILTTATALSRNPERATALTTAGATLLDGSGEIHEALRALTRFAVSTLLIEGGAALHAAAWRAGVIDRVHVIVAPASLGDAGVKFFDGIEVPMSALIPVRVDRLGPDTWLEADVHGHR
jgi:diaminohydroxyphosphoribosylaminopyrimidine deaminase/5-amino-6-(5-phosphoribosylamino)uracil reductase